MTPTSQPEPLLHVKQLSIDFQTEAGTVRAVDEISFT
ncbi:peptide ABC transporter ATP-binding protein, partial [Candidatus Entotheonella serta]